MNRISIATLASLALLAGCQKKETQNPDDANYDGFTDQTPGGEGDDVANAGDGGGAVTSPTGERPKVRSTSGTRGKTKVAGKHRSLVAKKPPVTSGEKPAKPPKKSDWKPTDPPVVLGATPTVLVAGGLFEVYGEAFSEDPAANSVFVGTKRQKVVAVAGDHLVVEAVGPATGPVSIAKGNSRVQRRVKGNKTATKNNYTVLAAGAGFATPRLTAGHGLLATIYDIGQPSQAVPDFNTVGDPVGYLMLDNLDVEGTFAGFEVGGKALAENFGLHLMGSLNILEAGDYELCLEAGAGAVLFLNGEPMLDVSTETGEVCELMEIDPGEYDLQVLYYQNDGDVALRMSWAKDGGAKEAIPAQAFFPPENLDNLAVSLNQ